MNLSKIIQCQDYPCTDVNTNAFTIPNIEIDPNKIKILMIAEAPPDDSKDYFYSPGNPFFLQTKLKAFKDAGVNASTMQDIIDMGIYLTTAIKCVKIGYGVSAATVNTCSQKILEKELSHFQNIQAYLLMGDVAIIAFNHITKRATGKRIVPSGSTYKIRKNTYFYEEKRVFPSYLMTGKSFLIEKSKQKMIAEDLRNALNLIRKGS
jgi:uracil-DNA glycosylase